MESFSNSEWVGLTMILFLLVYSLWEADTPKKDILSGQKSKLRMYRETILFLWLPISGLLLTVLFCGTDPSDIGIWWHSGWTFWAGMLMVTLFAIYLCWHVLGIRNDSEQRIQLAEAMKAHSWMMPATRKELNWFTCGVSCSAGICEEILYRGFLLGTLSPVTGMIGAVVFSSIVFGLCHIYQGWVNVIRTSVIGIILSGIYLTTNSLIIVIVLHALVDIYGGVIGYLANQSTRMDETGRQMRAAQWSQSDYQRNYLCDSLTTLYRVMGAKLHPQKAGFNKAQTPAYPARQS